MQPCQSCLKPPREDDTLAPIQLADHTTQYLCTDCRFALAGQTPPRRTYGREPPPPVDPDAPQLSAKQRWRQEQANPVPEIGDGMAKRKMRVCGICRQAMRRDDADDQNIRVTVEDLCDAGWHAYQQEVRQALDEFAAVQAAAEQLHAEEIRPQLAEKEASLRMAQQTYETAFDAAELGCSSQAELDARVKVLREHHDAMVNEIEKVYLLATGPQKLQRDAEVFKAGVKLRQEMRAAYARAQAIYTANPTALEPGVYQCCSDCLDRYTPRVRDRLIRDRVLSPAQSINDNFLL